jgi:hypothetical protein
MVVDVVPRVGLIGLVAALALALVGSSGGSPSLASADSGGAKLPTPTSYAETCGLMGWCSGAPAGRIPAALRRPLHFPKLGPHGACPTSVGREIDNNQFGGVALGNGPVRPLVARTGGDLKQGVVPFSRSQGTTGWWVEKIDWFSLPSYRGPILIRGRRLDRAGEIAFGGEPPAGEPELVDPQLPPGPSANGTDGWREWPGGNLIPALGCYGFQIDGTNFSTVIAFKAVKWKA